MKRPTMTDRIYGIEKKKYVIAAARSLLECNDSDILLSSHITSFGSLWNYRNYYDSDFKDFLRNFASIYHVIPPRGMMH